MGNSYNKLNISVSPTDKHGQWEVTEGLTYKGIQVEVGQLTDGASIPLVLQPFLRKGGPIFCPSVIHDTSYRNSYFNRAACDRIFLDAMVDNGVNKLERAFLYYGVRLFGGKSYNENKS